MDRHLIDLNAEIHKYLSKDFYPFKTFNGSAVNITVREVMSHMAGLHVSVFPDDFDNYLIRRADNVSHNIRPFKNEPLLSKPGTQFNYSNYGYIMTGAIIESILNNTYENEIKKMFTQLHMNSTFAERREMIVKHRPQYYQLSNETSGTLQKSDIIDELFLYEGWWPAGGIISTADDMLRFANAMLSAYHGKDQVQELWTPETIGKIKPDWMGDNEYVTHYPDDLPYPYKTLIWHDGGLTGVSTHLIIFPKENMVGLTSSAVS
ncbi:unnamed protein product [Oppiella nova]|uniref:Beta-lactamase-related domain-containing protein n=1 Tax=Oppiella nova TaxID=334625 RepID=A0A7R9QT01_9ACAR|nr:unnamed protein product [Oppiella nova]CAG2174597.1 unnamed protein product [Oppiella nova]